MEGILNKGKPDYKKVHIGLKKTTRLYWLSHSMVQLRNFFLEKKFLENFSIHILGECGC